MFNKKYFDPFYHHAYYSFQLRMAKYCYSIKHIHGELLHTGDPLSHAPISALHKDVVHDREVVDFIYAEVLAGLPVVRHGWNSIIVLTRKIESVLKFRYGQTGLPQTASVPSNYMPYLKVMGSLTVCERLLMFNDRNIIFKS